MHVQAGVDRLLEETDCDLGCRIALLTNDGACTASYVASRHALLAKGYQITKLFSPEHGLMAMGADGHPMSDGYDELTHLPVKSLYGDRVSPPEEDLEDIDVVLVDLPDVGCRCYTYLWTLTYVMEACASMGKELVVLDRANPISGVFSLAEGPMLDEEGCSSFIGRWTLPLRHSCTFGELARFWQATRLADLNLRVIQATGWTRDTFHPEWATSFVPTSPAITNFEACLLYSGLCLSESTNLSEGRGTGLAFRVLGAPWLDAVRVSEEFNCAGFPGVVARPISFVPEIGKHKGQGCKGVMLHVTDMRRIRPVATGLLLIKLIHDLHPGTFRWTSYSTHVNPSGERHLEKLLGLQGSQDLFEQAWPDQTKTTVELLDCAEWETLMGPHLLYK